MDEGVEAAVTAQGAHALAVAVSVFPSPYLARLSSLSVAPTPSRYCHVVYHGQFHFCDAANTEDMSDLT